jgi:hypothetical protein
LTIHSTNVRVRLLAKIFILILFFPERELIPHHYVITIINIDMGVPYRWVSLVGQELLTLPEHMSSSLGGAGTAYPTRAHEFILGWGRNCLPYQST